MTLAHTHDNISKMHETSLWWAMTLTGGYMFAEFVAGWMSGSLALMADALHMFTDVGALGLALFAVRWAARHADDHRTFGYGRTQVLAAFVNASTVMLLAAFLTTQAVRRFWTPHEVSSGLMFWVAVLGLFVNLVIFIVLHRNGKENLNMRAATLHVLGDLLSSAAVVGAALLIQYTGWYVVDTIATLVVAALIANSSRGIIKESAHILLEGRPRGLILGDVAKAIEAEVPEVKGLHHVHAWSLSGEDVLLTLHARVDEAAARKDDEIMADIKALLKAKFGISHSTIQFERLESCDDHHCVGGGHAHLAHDGHDHAGCVGHSHG